MPKAPTVNADQLGVVVDALTTTNAMMFSMLASPRDVEAVLAMLDRLASTRSDDPSHSLRTLVFRETAHALRELQALRGEQDLLGLPAMR